MTEPADLVVQPDRSGLHAARHGITGGAAVATVVISITLAG